MTAVGRGIGPVEAKKRLENDDRLELYSWSTVLRNQFQEVTSEKKMDHT